jgi:hypothetical protein
MLRSPISLKKRKGQISACRIFYGLGALGMSLNPGLLKSRFIFDITRYRGYMKKVSYRSIFSVQISYFAEALVIFFFIACMEF